ncbi:hypothetical protein DDP45_07850 [Helicobacter pylori]|nr:hypothetical protein DDP36_07880 [Helicobacter pylori]RDY79237.1 hypothetical protein DDP45_07850 [Helicobacter pylori]
MKNETPLFKAILSKKKKTELERVLFLVFMLFLKQINLKKVLNPLFYPFFKSLIKIFFTIP